MKFFKYLVMLTISAACCMGISSCSDDPDENGPCGDDSGATNESAPVNTFDVFKNGTPKKVGGIELSYYECGRVKEINNTDNGAHVQFDYTPDRRADDYDLAMTITGESGETLINIRLNDKGYAEYCKEYESDNYESDWKFEYNSADRLVKMTRSEGGNEVTDITYTDGNITSVKMRSDEEGNSCDFTIEYGSPMLDNKGCIMFFDETFGIDMDEMKYAYYAGLLGMPTKNLPVKLNDPGDNETENFEWTLDEKGMPTKFVSRDSYGYTETTTFEW